MFLQNRRPGIAYREPPPARLGEVGWVVVLVVIGALMAFSHDLERSWLGTGPTRPPYGQQ